MSCQRISGDTLATLDGHQDVALVVGSNLVGSHKVERVHLSVRLLELGTLGSGYGSTIPVLSEAAAKQILGPLDVVLPANQLLQTMEGLAVDDFPLILRSMKLLSIFSNASASPSPGSGALSRFLLSSIRTCHRLLSLL